jgi:hypothetical protein
VSRTSVISTLTLELSATCARTLRSTRLRMSSLRRNERKRAPWLYPPLMKMLHSATSAWLATNKHTPSWTTVVCLAHAMAESTLRLGLPLGRPLLPQQLFKMTKNNAIIC